MSNIEFNVNLGPYVWVEQRLSHGRTRLVKRFSRKDYGHVPVLRDSAKQVKVRFVGHGRMYAGFVPKKHVAAAHAPRTAYRPAAPGALGGMLGSLTAIEAQNRLTAHKAAQSR